MTPVPIDSASSAPPPDTTTPRVLIVDDEAILAEALSESLDLVGMDVRFVADPMAAITLLKSDPSITVLVSDLRMPGMDGFEVARQARAGRGLDDDLQVLLLTGFASIDTVIRAMHDGFADFIEKPPALDALIAAIRTAHTRALANRARAKLERIPQAAGPIDPARHAGDYAFVRALQDGLRNPLVPIVGLAELMSDSAEKLSISDIRKFATAIEASGRELTSLAERITLLASVEAHARVPKRDIIDVDALLGEMLRKWSAPAMRAGVTLSADLPPERGALVQSDRRLIAAAMDEMIDNAIKFAPGRAVSFGTRMTAYDATFHVCDDGPGFRQEQVRDVVAPFVQLDASLSGKRAGLGVGLAIATAIANLLEGRLEFDVATPGRTLARLVVPCATVPGIAPP